MFPQETRRTNGRQGFFRASGTPLILSCAPRVMLVVGFILGISTPQFSQQKLVFKDGTVEKVESYEVKADRIRFKSLERNQWEEVPLSLVDLDSTKKVNENEKESQGAKGQKTGSLDRPIQAAKDQGSVAPKVSELPEVAPGVKVPDAYGIYVWDGRNLMQLSEAGSRKRTDRKNVIINMVAPAPIMRQKVNIQLDGPTSDTNLRTPSPVFYAHLPEERGGILSLYRMIVTKSARVLKEVAHSQITGSDIEKSQEYIFTPSLRVAENVYKVFSTKPLVEGEYCLLVMSPEENRLETTVWDFFVVK
jgi:hypothetical protein